MGTRAQRLKRLVTLQEQIKALHETRHATQLAQAARAKQDASELLEALNAASPLPGLFPDVYNRHIGAAIDREAKAIDRAEKEKEHVATATARTKIAERAWREAFLQEEREAAEKEQLENVERKLNQAK